MAKTLIVDDDPDAEAMFSGSDGNDFFFARSDAEAIEILTSRDDLDIAIVAVDSEAVSGMGLFHKLDAKDARLPRIALSASPDIELLRQSLKDGASDFMVKPVAADELKETLSRVYEVCERRRNSWKNETELSAIRREIEIASEIQRRILPRRFPFIEGVDVFARTLPAKDMGGDFYDLFVLPDGQIGLVIADVSGKGIPAAFFMAVARTLIRATAFHEAGAGACLEQVNRLLCRHDVPGMFVSVFYGVLDRSTWRMTYANGGHPLPLVVRPEGNFGAGDGDGVFALEGGRGTLLGIDEEQTYEEDELALAPGDGIYFYTDGLTEAFNADHKPFGEDRLQGAMTGQAAGSPSDLAGAVAKALSDFVGDAPQHDDITSLVIKRVE
ncbi:MAG: SpoIIE family protein phosphatase [Alphaproteobacteria bacterium]|nr:SpoIIE family protein phosphatase [Alphaproteobacteria bacterium]